MKVLNVLGGSTRRCNQLKVLYLRFFFLSLGNLLINVFAQPVHLLFDFAQLAYRTLPDRGVSFFCLLAALPNFAKLPDHILELHLVGCFTLLLLARLEFLRLLIQKDLLVISIQKPIVQIFIQRLVGIF